MLPDIGGEVMWAPLIEDTDEPSNKTTFIESLKDNPSCMIEWGFTPEAIPSLLDTSVEICYKLFYCLNGHQSIAK
jgi:hypothetical protein